MASRRLFDGASEEIGQLPIVAAAVDQTWTGTDATVTVTATSGEFSAGGGSPQTWTGTDATVTVTATSGSWSQTGPITRPLTPTTGAGTGSSVSSFTVTDPGVIDTDDVVIVVVTSRRDRTITTPTGWNVLGPVQAGNNDNTGNNLYVFWRRGEPSTWVFTLSSSSSGWAWVCDVFRGCITSGDPWFSTATNSGTDASVEVSALSSLPPGCMAVAVAGYSDSSGAGGTPTTYGSNPSGWASTSSFNSSNQQGALLGYDDLVGDTSVAQATWTLDQAPNNWTSRMLALSPQQVTWAGTDGTVTVTATSGEFTAGGGSPQTWTGTDGTVTVTATSGTFTPGGVTWVGTDGTVTITATSGEFSGAGSPQTWTGTDGTITITATSGTFTPGAVAWTGTDGTVTVTATSGSWAPGVVTWVGTDGTITILATEGSWSQTGGVQTWTGTDGTVTITATSGTFASAATGIVCLTVAADAVTLAVGSDSVTITVAADTVALVASEDC